MYIVPPQKKTPPCLFHRFADLQTMKKKTIIHLHLYFIHLHFLIIYLHFFSIHLHFLIVHSHTIHVAHTHANSQVFLNHNHQHR